MKVNRPAYLVLLTLLTGILYFAGHGYESPFSQRLLASTLDLNQVKTNTNRMAAVAKLCQGTTRSDLITSSEKSSNDQYFSIMKVYFNKDLMPYITLAATMQIDVLLSKLQSDTQLIVPFAIYVVPFLLGFILGLTLWTCLCCCCTCPSCCPCSKCCRHDDLFLYTKCEMLWPAIFLLIVLALAIAASVPGLTQAGKLSSSVQTMECGVALGMDDLLNGNVTMDQTSFFFGIDTLMGIFNTMKSQLTNLNNNLTAITSGGGPSSLSSIISDSNTIMTNFQAVANPSVNQSANIQYTTPTPSSGTVTSLFNSILGNPSVSNSIIGTAYTGIKDLNGNLTTIQSSITTVQSGFSNGSLSSGIDSALGAFSPIVSQINGYTDMITGIFDFVNPYLSYVKLAVLIFFAVAIGLSVIALVGLVLTAFFDKPRCRYLMYVACLFMVLIVILGFILSLIFSLLTPMLYMTCNILNQSISTSDNVKNFTQTLGIQGLDMIQAVGVCFPGGDGQILTALAPSIPQLSGLQAQINNMSTFMNGFDDIGNFDTSPLTNADTSLQNKLDSWVKGQFNDISSDSASQVWFNQIRDTHISDYSSCSGAPVFQTNYPLDSLVTSTSPDSTQFFPCSKSNILKCTAPSQTFASLTGNGCIDLTSCFETQANVGDVGTHISARYNCAQLTTDIQTLYTQWDQQRRNAVGGIKTTYVTNVGNNIVTMASNMNGLKSQFTTIKNDLTNSMKTVVDPDYGLFAGLNCKVIGEDVINAKDTICVSLFNSFFFLFVTVGTTSFAFLFALCCIVCTGVRNFKQDTFKVKILADSVPDTYDQTFVHLQGKKGYD